MSNEFDKDKPEIWLKRKAEAEAKKLAKKEQQAIDKVTKKTEELATRFDDWSFTYDKTLDGKFFALAEKGKSLTEISYLLKIPKDRLVSWSDDINKKSFGRSFTSARVACQAFHERLYNDMIQGNLDKAPSAKQIDAQANVLKTMFQEDWAPVVKQELEINTNNMDQEELDLKLRALLESDHVRSHLKDMADRGFKTDIKAVEDE